MKTAAHARLEAEALAYHARGRPGKLAVAVTKPCATQRDLCLAYTPGVAEPVRHIHLRPSDAYRYTAKGNLVAVVSNGTAVLGLGNVGALAGKPVMEGKALLFKRFADVDVFDLEIDAPDPDDVVRIVTALEPTFGGINLEDIKAPDCFLIEERLRAVMTIPVFHDDQHGTAIVTGAALLNAVELTGRSLVHPRIVIGGAGAAAIASAHLLCTLGVPRENIILVDTRGVIHAERVDGMNAYKRLFATRLPARTLADALAGADVFVGLSAGGIVTREMVRTITQEMKIAAVRALAEIAKAPVPRDVLQAHGIDALAFGPGYLIPKPLDSRVPIRVAVAVAEAAMRGGIADAGVPLDAYEHTLERRLGWHR